MKNNNGLNGEYVRHHDLDSTLEFSFNHEVKCARQARGRNSAKDVPGFVRRMKVFAIHGCNCDLCGLKGTDLIETKANDGAHHIDLYGKNRKGEYVMMNRDHILPRSKGGPEAIWNLRPTCSRCNGSRGNKHGPATKEIYEYRIRWTHWNKFFFKWMPFLAGRTVYDLSKNLSRHDFHKSYLTFYKNMVRFISSSQPIISLFY